MPNKLTRAQRAMLVHISEPTHFFPNASTPRMWRSTLDRLSGLGLAENVRSFSSEPRNWRITPAGLRALKESDNDR